jgi:hypothetical protein
VEKEPNAVSLPKGIPNKRAKTIHEVAEMVGIPKTVSEQILQQVLANTAALESCAGHDFSIALDRHTKKPIKNPTHHQQTFDCKWRCSKCGGYIDAINRTWYNRGLKDGTNH